MNLLTQVLHIVGSGASAYIMARNLRDAQSRPNILASFQMAESGSVPFLEKMRDRAAAEGDTWLAEQLERHASDEKRHGQIFAQALKRHHKQVIDFKRQSEEAKQDDSKKENRRSPFFDAYFKDYTQDDLKAENIDWIVFIASTYILELDASKDFRRMASVLPDDDLILASTKNGILSVAQDETRHASYLYEALHRRLTAAEAQPVIDQWRKRKVDALFAMVGNFIERNGKTRTLVQDGAPTDTTDEVEVAELKAA